jgi:hypothetical protein
MGTVVAAANPAAGAGEGEGVALQQQHVRDSPEAQQEAFVVAEQPIAPSEIDKHASTASALITSFRPSRMRACMTADSTE